MVDVGVWQPDEVPLNAATLARLAAVADLLDEPTLGLSEQEVARFAVLMKYRSDDWSPLLTNETDTQLIRLAKLFTVAEMRLPGWDAGARSPVIRIVAELRRRNVYPKELTAWIKAHTTNRYLPHGSLLDRL